jgi:hypothetical protein
MSRNYDQEPVPPEQAVKMADEARAKGYAEGIARAADLVRDDAGIHSSPWLEDHIIALGEPSPGTRAASEREVCPECRQFPCIGHPATPIAKEFALDLEGWTWELFGTRDPEKLRDKLRVILPAYAWKYRADYEDVAGDAPREDALRKYGTHLSGCRLTNGGDRCTCGFETALRGPVSPSPGENIICPECRQFPCIGHPGTRAASEGEA